MNFRSLDLNLLMVLDALFETRSVSGAARLLKVSQPTVSFSLQKLRDTLGDELFVRSARGMEPTPRASRMRETVHTILRTVEEKVLAPERFDPATLTGTFTFSTSDVGELVFLPAIIERLRATAPRVAVASVSLPPARLTAALESAEVDLAIGYFPDLTEGIVQQGLFEHPFVCLVRRDHPTIGDQLSLSDFLAAEHAVVSAEGRSQEIFEREVAKRRLSRRVVLTTPHFLSAPLLIAGSDLIATVPKAVAMVWASRARVKIMAPPIDVRPIPLKQFWHRRFHEDPRSIWLRTIIAALFQGADPSEHPDFPQSS